MTTIAIDAMGGDHGPPVTVPAALSILAAYPDLRLILVGDRSVLEKALSSQSFPADRLTIQHASQQVAMDESPSQALRTKKDSSMRVAINLVKDGTAQACVSAGNTGALMATARFVLKTLPGIDRPAIISTFPTITPDKNMRMLDLGANVECSSSDLVQFAVMGSVLASAIDNINNPKVYLLNIGEEEIKGTDTIKQAAHMLSQTPSINYAGFIEGDSLYLGDADVIVCDGFVGNVALKTTEGVALYITRLIKAAFMRNAWTKFVGVLAKPILATFARRIDPGNFNGATFIGLQGTVIKSHGGAKTKAFANAIKEAMRIVEKHIPERIKDNVEQLLKSLPSQHE